MKAIFASAVLTLIALCSTANADSRNKPHINQSEIKNLQAAAKTCTENQKQYDQAISKIIKTEIFKQILTDLNSKSKIIFGGVQRDQPVLWRKHCYHSVSIYIDSGDKLELKKSFLISKNFKVVHIAQPDGNYERLKNSN